MFGEDLAVSYAPEATNIIWENLANSGRKVLINKIITMTVVAGVLILALVGFTYLKAMAARRLFSFPPSTNCSAIQKLYVKTNDKGTK